ncbi:MAG: CvpA family protein [Planctomycetota bacterium]|jgi:hypothetical protein
MIGTLISLMVVLIIAAWAAYEYSKGTFLRAFAMIIVFICASSVAFNYFETLANIFIGRGGVSKFPAMADWAQMLSFLLLFVLCTAILQTILLQLTKEPVNFGIMTERVGRITCGVVGGLILAGSLITAADMAAIPSKYPYQRFDEEKPNAEKPNKVFLNADGFVTGWFSLISKGCLSGKTSFASVHPSLINEIYLNRFGVDNKLPLAVSKSPIAFPKKNIIHLIDGPLERAEEPDNPIKAERGHKLAVIRTGIIFRIMTKYKGAFTPSQLRVVCKRKGYAKEMTTGKGKNIYPIGYLNAKGQIEVTQLNRPIQLKKEEDSEEDIIWFDFVFEVPDDYSPVLIGFKQNIIAQIPSEKQSKPDSRNDTL